MATLITAVGTVSSSTSAGAPYYGALDMPVDAAPRPKSPMSVLLDDDIVETVRQHHDRIAHYRQMSGQDAPEDHAFQQPEEVPQRPTVWQSIWSCLRCRD